MKKVDGYKHGERFDLVVVSVEGVMLEIATAKAFIDMQLSAFADQINLVPLQGFRSMEQQTKLYSERLDPKVQKIKGIAAKPGFSNHQSGVAIDILTGLTVSQFARGMKTDVYLWLESNAQKFNFFRTVRSEPWHWEYKTSGE